MKRGFTFIELMIVMAILAILTGIVTGNVINSLKKGRDTERKADLHQIQNALELYYHDHHAYPTPQDTHGLPFGINGLEEGGTVYIKKLPQDPIGNSYLYTGNSTGTYYSLYSTIENDQDNGQNVSQSGYNTDKDCSADGTSGIKCKYGVSSPNITLAPTLIP